ncbi:anti sigma factor C-terminal domain-containing protein [Levilactobacillus tujiorum]|uniref:anti sigma factor C-terminal domain-containing protein n=1 Tax=Levilactobacillus tujiorum TaxID=2912243 RepID=UPI0014563ECB|nr:anti sigma factor C-terminal domain-containing protein [Levilactobacillus tujiorum]NLR31044.1 anti-sigma factor [Levilactobacillus tujiorum]
MNEGKEFRRLARRVKFRRWVLTGMIAMIVVMVAIPVTYKLTQLRAAKVSNEMIREMETSDHLMSPNIAVSDQHLGNTSAFGGQVISHRYKEVEGYRVPWSSVVRDYSWLTGSSSTLSNATDQNKSSLYDRETEQKIPMFFNQQASRPNLKATHDLAKIGQSKGAVAEVALTFKQPLTYRQVQAKLPAGLHAQWYWIGVSDDADPTSMDNNLLGLSIKDIGLSHRPSEGLTQNDYRSFYQGLKYAATHAPDIAFDDFRPYKYGGQYAKRYPIASQAKFAGVIVTGNSEAFRPLDKANWIYASSAGFFKQRSVIK